VDNGFILGSIHHCPNYQNSRSDVVDWVILADVAGYEGIDNLYHWVADQHGAETDAGGACHIQIPFYQVEVCRFLQIADQLGDQVALDVFNNLVVRFAFVLQGVLFLNYGAPEFDSQRVDLSILWDVHVAHLCECDLSEWLNVLAYVLIVLANEVDHQHQGLLGHVEISVFGLLDDVVDDVVPLDLLWEWTLQKVEAIEDRAQGDSYEVEVWVVKTAGQDGDQVVLDVGVDEVVDIAVDFDQLFTNLAGGLDAGHAHLEVLVIVVGVEHVD